MNITLLIVVGMLILSIAAPFISLYAVSQYEIDNETDPVKKAKMKLIDEAEFATILNQVLKGDF